MAGLVPAAEGVEVERDEEAGGAEGPGGEDDGFGDAAEAAGEIEGGAEEERGAEAEEVDPDEVGEVEEEWDAAELFQEGLAPVAGGGEEEQGGAEGGEHELEAERVFGEVEKGGEGAVPGVGVAVEVSGAEEDEEAEGGYS